MIPPNLVRVLAQSGAILVGLAIAFAGVAWLHMREFVQAYGVICGSDSSVMAHCPACYASLVSFVAGSATLVLARAANAAAQLKARSIRSA